MIRRIHHLALALLLLTVALTPAARAAGVTQVLADLAPRQGVIVLPLEEDYLIDLDAASGIRVGDLFVVTVPGEQLRHPVSGEALGTLDRVRSTLQVTQVKSGYSHAALLPGSAPAARGEAIRSFTGLRATLWDYTGRGEALLADLRAGLPALEWSSYAAAQQSRPKTPGAVEGLSGLLFVLTDAGLEVRDARYQLIRAYPEVAAARPAAPGAAPAAAGIVAATAPAAGGIVQRARSGEGVWYGPEILGAMSGVAVADFDGDGRREVVSAVDDQLQLGRVVDGAYQELGSLSIARETRMLTLEALDLDQDGRAELYVTAVRSDLFSRDDKAASFCVELIDGQLSITQESIDLLLGTVHVPGEGTVLLGQRLGGAGRTYEGELLRMERRQGRLVRGQPFKRPKSSVSVHGFNLLPAAGQPPLYAFFESSEQLRVHAASGSQLWKSSETQGGSEAAVRHADPNPREVGEVSDFLKAPLRVTATGLLLVPVNEGSTRVLSWREFTKSRVIAYRWEGRSLKEQWSTEPQGGYLAGFCVADLDNDGADEVVMAVVFARGSLLQRGTARSALVAYKLPDGS